MSSDQAVSSHFLSVIVMRLGLTRTEQFYGSIFSNSLHSSGHTLVASTRHLLVEVQHVDVAFFVGDPDVTQVLFEVDLDHFRGDCPAELAGLEVHLHFVFLVAPGELADFLRHEGRLGHSGTSFFS